MNLYLLFAQTSFLSLRKTPKRFEPKGGDGGEGATITGKEEEERAVR